MKKNNGKRKVKSIPREKIINELDILKGQYESKNDIGTIKLDGDCELVLEFIKKQPLKYPMEEGISNPIDKKTLKRLFGIEKFEGAFSLKTLTIVAYALGYKDWDDFVEESSQQENIKEYDRVYDLQERDYFEKLGEITSLKPGTKIRFILGSYSRSFIVEKSSEHAYAYILKVVAGLALRRKVGDLFYAPSFEINEGVIHIFDPYNWFDEPEQKDLKKQKDYCIL